MKNSKQECNSDKTLEDTNKRTVDHQPLDFMICFLLARLGARGGHTPRAFHHDLYCHARLKRVKQDERLARRTWPNRNCS
jgi:hypothetical protein